ncbi:hypothetical protein CHS0354_006116 [Potamilus streckersoni]|uniref:Vinculin n=1 Tax=Potamilus streckersoni TaxID=2493646 RepID=A0AAE0ST56_9BIVA|nr:hypothetical protein CHS0354_006116 [Potamilus streckersoni]
MVPCAQGVLLAAEKLIAVARSKTQNSSDQDLKAQMTCACEVLDLASSNLLLTAQRLEANSGNKEVRNKLVQATKDVLQGTMKVLMVSDDAEVRMIVIAANVVTEKISVLTTVNTMTDLVPNFKEFTDALAVFSGLVNKRQKDLINSRQCDCIVMSLGTLKKSVPSLSVVLQTTIKHAGNVQTEVNRSYIIQEVLNAIQSIVDVIRNRTTADDLVDVEEPGYFVIRVDQAIEALSQDNRDDLDPDLEIWTEGVIRHGMMVAHLCLDSYRDLIVKTCQRILQVKGMTFRLFESLQTNPEITKIKEDYDDACEIFIDEFCELEKNVSVALLHLIVDVFQETTEPLERLVKAAMYPQQGQLLLNEKDELVIEFQDHSEKMFQIASQAAALSTDAKRVRVIKSCLHHLERLDPEMVPAVLALAKAPQSHVSILYLKRLMKEWTFELTNLIQVIDDMTDPRMFILVSERKVEDEINTCNGFILTLDPKWIALTLRSIVARSKRVAQIGEKIVDNHDDPIFRNGLMVHVQQLKKAVTAVRASGSKVISDARNQMAVDMLHRRFDLLQDSLNQVKVGLSGSNHPPILSPLRRNVRYQQQEHKESPQITGVLLSPKLPNKDSSSKGESHTQQSGFGNRFIATSDPRLRLWGKEQEVISVPQSSNMQKSISLTHAAPISHDSHAGMVVANLTSMARKGDKQKVNLHCGELLGWTNHIVDAAQNVANHCQDTQKQKSIRDLCFEVDQLAPQVIDKAKFVLVGDFSQLQDMHKQSEEWGTKIEKLRIYVDMTVEYWMNLCDRMCDALKRKNTDLLKQQLKTLQTHQQAAEDLVYLTESLRSESQVRGQDRLCYLWAGKDELENLTVTLATTAELFTQEGVKEEILQLEQLGREWSVMIYCHVSTIEKVAEELIDLGIERKLWDKESVHLSYLDLLAVVETENMRLKDLLKSSCAGQEDTMETGNELCKELIHLQEDIKVIAMHKRSSGVTQITMGATLYTKERISLIKGKWTLKVLQSLDLVRQQTNNFGIPVDKLVDLAFKVKATANGEEREVNKSQFLLQVKTFSDNANMIRKKVLNGIQLSAELDKRSAVRQGLDGLMTYYPKVIDMAKKLAEADFPSNMKEVNIQRQNWSTKARYLVVSLRSLSDLRPSLLPEVMKLLEVDENLQVPLVKEEFTPLPPGIVMSSLSQHASVTSVFMPTSHLGQSLDFMQATVDQRMNSDLSKDESRFAPSQKQEVNVNRYSVQRRSESPKQQEALTKSCTASLLESVEYLQRETERWEDENNPVVQVAQLLSQQIQQMAHFIHGKGPITSHAELIQVAKAVLENGNKMLKFARILATHCVDQGFAKDLYFYANQIPTVLQQLKIISTLQMATANANIADQILVKNSQNLMKVILRTVRAAEAVCVKGLNPPSKEEPDETSVIVLATKWRQKCFQHREEEMKTAVDDELGLKRIEQFRPPKLTQIFDSLSI